MINQGQEKTNSYHDENESNTENNNKTSDISHKETKKTTQEPSIIKYTQSELRDYISSEYRAISINARRAKSIISKLSDADLVKVSNVISKIVLEEQNRREEAELKEQLENESISNYLEKLKEEGIDMARVKNFLDEKM